jgi:hypothetical protein
VGLRVGLNVVGFEVGPLGLAVGITGFNVGFCVGLKVGFRVGLLVDLYIYNI